MNSIQSVQFYDQEIQVLKHDNKPYVEMKSIVENIGLDWSAQYRRIKRNNILDSSVAIMAIVAKDGRKRELICY